MASPADTLTKKAGPLPVWGWAVAALVLYVAYTHLRNAPSVAAAVTPAPNIQGSGSSTGDAGMGNPAGNLSADLLSQLGQGVFGIHDAYNTWTYSPTSSYEYSSTSSTTTDYGTGNTYGGGSGGGSGTHQSAPVNYPPTDTGPGPAAPSPWPIFVPYTPPSTQPVVSAPTYGQLSSFASPPVGYGIGGLKPTLQP